MSASCETTQGSIKLYIAVHSCWGISQFRTNIVLLNNHALNVQVALSIQ